MPRPARRALPTLLCLAALLLSTGCQRVLMRPPVMFDQTRADPFDELPASERRTSATIFYATNRKPDPDNKELPYGPFRDSALTLGQVDVRIGKDMTWDELLRKTLGPIESRRPPLFIDPPEPFGPLLTTAPPHVIRERAIDRNGDSYEEFTFVARQNVGGDARAFADALNAEMAATAHPDIYVYVHGYRNSFVDAVESAASLHHYNGRRGAIIAFSWPSQKHLLDYFEDRESATYSVSDLRQLLVFLAEHTEAQRIHLIAHSMGTFLASNTLREMRLIGFDQTPEQLRERFRIDNVVLVAPDIDLDVLGRRFFREGFQELGRRMTIYTSPDDKALAVATRLLFGILRAGSVTGEELSENQRMWLKAHPEVTFIDTTGQKTFGLGHSHHTENPGVASDLLLLLAHDLPPEHRGLIQRDDTGVWRFPPDYPTLVRELAERYYPLLGENPAGVPKESMEEANR
jgi:esterase/lipase superfamily enzyme